MSSPIDEFAAVVQSLAPRVAIVLGSGLGDVTRDFREAAAITFANIPGLVPSTVQGHRGQLVVGRWVDKPLLVFGGRIHFYEGHTHEIVTGTVRVASELGVRRILLTNAAGGIHTSLHPGSMMAIHRHLRVIGSQAWRDLANHNLRYSPYSPALTKSIVEHESRSGRRLLVGTYVALTGPCYETPAEIRALRSIGADAVGMSTALEAEAAVKLGLEVAAISCITNSAAGLSDNELDHSEVLTTASQFVSRLREIIEHVLLLDM